ncbi:hypothetical protein NCCP2716_31110 [Sporosarcina sp. NCCP-2716]|uniref:hypothetical protein n=1 Tax=Sporosarcina sp. NCCP-2716 TaxID=2943679 RepID=UPI00203B37B2|nr:hypothetical protein [Sporosarcina sp. NCCP-2716]GKV70613.1 hypothetical protein NCCP2716_31110 [Sporosarcina sp. NCCP-2716]
MKNIIRNAFLLLVLLLCAAGCQQKGIPSTESVVRYSQGYELTGREKEKLVGPVHPGLFAAADRNNPGAGQVSIPVVPKTGESIELPAGRYMITGYPTGNIYVLDAEGKTVLREIVGDYAGAHSLTVSIEESYTIRADGGFDSVEVTPAATSLQNVLTAGIWEVGTDIAPGRYTISLDETYGYLQVLEEGKEPLLYELVGGTAGRTEGSVELKEGQWLRVTETGAITFTPAGR